MSAKDWDAETGRGIIRALKHVEGALLPVLHALQDRFGYVDAAAVPVIADELNLSRAEVHGVISFYHDFRKHAPGQHIVKICRAEACQSVGGRASEEHAKERLNAGFHETSADGRYTLEPVYCLGNCACAPSAMIDGKLHGRVDAEALRPVDRCAGGQTMTGPMSGITVYVPCDASAVSLGADEVAHAIQAEADKAKTEIKIIRNGSRGLFWLEPMVEVATPQGRIAYGPVGESDVAGLFAAGFLQGGEHALRLGKPEEIPYLKNQERLTFERCGVIDPLSIEDYIAHGGYRGLANALKMQPTDIVTAVTESGLRGRGGAGFPTGIKWKTVLGCKADQKYIVCNADEGDSGTFADRMLMEGDPFLLIEGMTIAGPRGRRHQGLRLYPQRISARLRADAARDRGARRPRAISATTCGSAARRSTWSCGSAPAPISAARRPRCSTAWKASAAWCGRSRRCPPSRACSASRP